MMIERFPTQELKRGSCFGLVLAAGIFSNGYPRQYYGAVYLNKFYFVVTPQSSRHSRS